MTANVAFIVLGMHRSGTSATAGMLYRLGFQLGENLMRPEQESNELGFYENYDLVVQNDHILKAIHSDWDDHNPLPQGWLENPDIRPAQDEIARIVEEQFADTQLWVLKDPRLCRILPAWGEVFAARETHPYFIIVFRDPLEVAQSLEKRDGLSIEHGLRLWYSYMREAERNTRGSPRVFVFYDDLLGNWRRVVKSMRKMFVDKNVRKKRTNPIFASFTPSREQAAVIGSYLNTDEKHHNVSSKNTAIDVPVRITRFFDLLRQATGVSGEAADGFFTKFELAGDPDFEDIAAWWRAEAARWQAVAQNYGDDDDTN